MNSQRYVLIAGQGRSGTNWILEILDLSRQTHCRNEPNECSGSALFGLPSGRVSYPGLDAKLERTWDEAVGRTSRSFGARDQSIVVYKDHFFPAGQRAGLVRLARSKKLRRILGQIMPFARREEWPLPFWVVGKRQRDASLPVHKLNMVPGWIVWVLRNRPEAHVVHIVRHPGGVINSITKRLWSTLDTRKVEHDNRERLAAIADHHPSWADRFGDLAVLSPVEMELWYWRYACESIHEAGVGNPRYQLVRYEELTRRPMEISRSVYDACGLCWSSAIERDIARMSADSQSIAAAWRDHLDADQISLIERILHDSLMRDWWTESELAGTERIAESQDSRLAAPVEASS